MSYSIKSLSLKKGDFFSTPLSMKSYELMLSVEELLNSGHDAKRIAEKLGYTRQRISQIIEQSKYIKAAKDAGMINISVRSMNCLKKLDITNVDHFEGLTKEAIMEVPNFGQKSYNSLEDLAIRHGYKTREEGGFTSWPIAFTRKGD